MNQRLGDGEAKPRTVITFGELAFDLLEWTAEARKRLLRNANAGVGDHQPYGVTDHAAADDDAAVVRGELDRVRQQIDDDLFHRAAIGDHRDGVFDVGL
ncbi:hypothetical protein ASC80_21375 [Afipia sp. Root123D2]|nr:hypothetical protein ASC80_21375 [Afipia sp. Root123D2]